MSPWKVIFATLVIFCSGLVTGSLLVRKISAPARVSRSASSQTNAVNLSSWHQQQREFLRRIDKELDLSPEQHNRVEIILKDSQERTKAIREKIAPEMKEELKKVREQIRAELTPEQQKKFEESMKPKQPRKEDKEKSEERRRKKELQSATNSLSKTNQ